MVIQPDLFTEAGPVPRVQTSNFASLKAIREAGLVPVGIARGLPRFFAGASDQRLAPSRAVLKLPRPEYDRQFLAHLAGLDPKGVWDSLPDGAVLLCWERHGEGCHRRVVAEWFEDALGVVVPEFGFRREQTPPYAATPWATK